VWNKVLLKNQKSPLEKNNFKKSMQCSAASKIVPWDFVPVLKN
jgi:hypothetical protein